MRDRGGEGGTHAEVGGFRKETEAERRHVDACEKRKHGIAWRKGGRERR